MAKLKEENEKYRKMAKDMEEKEKQLQRLSALEETLKTTGMTTDEIVTKATEDKKRKVDEERRTVEEFKKISKATLDMIAVRIPASQLDKHKDLLDSLRVHAVENGELAYQPLISTVAALVDETDSQHRKDMENKDKQIAEKTMQHDVAEKLFQETQAKLKKEQEDRERERLSYQQQSRNISMDRLLSDANRFRQEREASVPPPSPSPSPFQYQPPGHYSREEDDRAFVVGSRTVPKDCIPYSTNGSLFDSKIKDPWLLSLRNAVFNAKKEIDPMQIASSIIRPSHFKRADLPTMAGAINPQDLGNGLQSFEIPM